MHAISWSGYWLATALTVGSYYAIIYFLFFRGRKKGKGATRKGTVPGRAKNLTEGQGTGPVPATEPKGQTGEPEAILQTQVHDMVDEMGAFIRQAGREKMEKEVLLTGLQGIARKYPMVAASAFKEGVRNLVAVTVEEHCACRLSADELRMLWDGGQA